MQVNAGENNSSASFTINTELDKINLSYQMKMLKLPESK